MLPFRQRRPVLIRKLEAYGVENLRVPRRLDPAADSDRKYHGSLRHHRRARGEIGPELASNRTFGE